MYVIQTSYSMLLNYMLDNTDEHKLLHLRAKRTCFGELLYRKNGKLQKVSDYSYEIPLLESLQCLLKTDIIQEQVFTVEMLHIHACMYMLI